jgi:hypothetical protein
MRLTRRPLHRRCSSAASAGAAVPQVTFRAALCRNTSRIIPLRAISAIITRKGRRNGVAAQCAPGGDHPRNPDAPCRCKGKLGPRQDWETIHAQFRQFHMWVEQCRRSTAAAITDNHGSHKVAGMRWPSKRVARACSFCPSTRLISTRSSKSLPRSRPLLRQATPRTRETLWIAIGRSLDRFSPAECANYIRHCGYKHLRLKRLWPPHIFPASRQQG